MTSRTTSGQEPSKAGLVPAEGSADGGPARAASAASQLAARRAAVSTDMLQSLICVSCHRTPVLDKIVWSDSLRQHIHTANRNPTSEGIARICGGQVVRKEDAWRATVLPGSIHVCYSSKLRGVAHLVRLGRPANARNESWTGTALCGAVLAAGHWIPTGEGSSAQTTCAACLKAQRRRGAPEPGDD